MPEGDTIFRTARTLGRALSGRIVTGFSSSFPQLNRIDEDEPVAGRTVTSVSSHGKHLLIRMSGDLTLRTHSRMKGSWHIYRPGEKWSRSARNARIVLKTDEFVAVAFSVPVAELLRSTDEARNRELRRLGPDLLDEHFDFEEALARFRAHPNAEVADLLLDQTIMAGVGNVYKSEILFLCGVHPRRTVESLDSQQLQCLIETSRRLLVENVSSRMVRPGQRRTTRRLDPSARLAVYGHNKGSCPSCGSAITHGLIGRNPRITYWCPSCQSAPTR